MRRRKTVQAEQPVKAVLAGQVITVGPVAAAELGVPVGTEISVDDPADAELYQRHQAFAQAQIEAGL